MRSMSQLGNDLYTGKTSSPSSGAGACGSSSRPSS